MSALSRVAGALRLEAVAIALIVLLLADAVAVGVVPRAVTLKAPGELADVIPELQRFVEKTRGRRFHRQVDIRLSDDLGSLRTGLNQSAGGTDAAAADAAVDQAALLLALGLVDQRYDPNATRRSLDDEILGAYDPSRHRLTVRPGPMTPRKRLTLVHELTHALDGEHHELRRRTRRVLQDESATSFRALAEGSAQWVERAYRDTLRPEEVAQLDAARKPPPEGVPEALLALASYPYAAGEQFVRNLVVEQGVGGIDDAFDRPPTTSEQILHVDRYLADDEPANVVKPVPRPGGKVVQRSVFGEFLLRLVVARSVDVPTAQKVGTGWGGGRYVAWREGVQLCVRATFAMDTDADAAELVDALRQWAAKRGPGASVAAGPPVAIANCAER